MLSQASGELERAGLITRTVYPVVPLPVEYALTPLGETVVPCIDMRRRWGADYLPQRT